MGLLEKLKCAFGGRPLRQTAWSSQGYYNNDRIVVHSESRTHNGVGWFNQPVYSMERGSGKAALGAIVREALGHSVWDSREDDSELKRHPILKHAKAKSWRDLERRYSHLWIETDRETVTFQCLRRPRKREEGSGGYILMKGDEVPRMTCDWDCGDELLGEKLIEVMRAYETEVNDRQVRNLACGRNKRTSRLCVRKK